MLPSFLLALREGLEAALIIGIVLGALRKFHHTQLNRVVWAGAGAAALLSLGAAFGLHSVGLALEGAAEEIFEGAMMFLAAGVLTWMIFWMHRQSRHLKGEIETGVRRAALQNSKTALFSLAFLAVLREGIELALFLTAASFATSPETAQTASSALTVVLGGVLGLIAAAGLGWALFASTARLNLRLFFQVTGALLILFAAGLVAHGVHEFNEVGWIPGVVEHVWDVNPVLPETSLPGQIMAALFGYNGNPSLTEVIAYLLYFTGISLALWLRRMNVPAVQEA